MSNELTEMQRHFFQDFEMNARRTNEEEGSYLKVMTDRRFEVQRSSRSKDGKRSLSRYIVAVKAPGSHLIPFRTETLSPAAPMVLHYHVEE